MITTLSFRCLGFTLSRASTVRMRTLASRLMIGSKFHSGRGLIVSLHRHQDESLQCFPALHYFFWTGRLDRFPNLFCLIVFILVFTS